MKAILFGVILSLSVSAPARATAQKAGDTKEAEEQKLAAECEGYPKAQITTVVPAAPGNSSDNVGRLVMHALGDRFKSVIVIDNKPATSGHDGAIKLMRSKPDGLTLMLAQSHVLTINPLVWPLKDQPANEDLFEPISLIAAVPYVLVLSPKMSSQVNSLEELVAKIKANPGKFSYGHGGFANQTNLFMRKFLKAAGIENHEVISIPYGRNGTSAAQNDLLGSHIDMMLQSAGTISGYVSSKQVKALGITSLSSEDFGDVSVPPIAETYPLFGEALNWIALVAPKGTPEKILTCLKKETHRILPSLYETLTNKYKVIVKPSEPEALRELIKADSALAKEKIEEIRRENEY